MSEVQRMRAAGYFRVSDEDQLEGYSLDAQRRAFMEFCAQKGWEVVETYNEEGRSAWIESKAKRQAFRQMLDDARARKFDVVVTHSLDRFSRNLRVMLDAFHIFSKCEVTYVSITQEIDYSTPEGNLFMTMLGAFAQYFSDALSGHTKKGMRERAQQGLFNGDPPFGYVRCDSECIGLDESHTGCHIDWDKASKVVEAFERYATGTESMSTLANWLNDHGCRTNGKRRAEIFGEKVAVDGRRFTHWAVRDILKNTFYLGKVRHRKEVFEGRHQGIVGQEVFDRVQERIRRNRSRRAVSASSMSRNPHLLTGLLRCHECGTTLWSELGSRDRLTYYRSPDKGLVMSCKHKGRRFSGRDFDRQANQLFGSFKLRQDWIDYTIKEYIRGSDREAALRRRQGLENRVERARRLYLDGDLGWEEFTKIKERAESEAVSIYIPEFDDVVEAGKILGDFGSLWQSASVARRNRLLMSMLTAIYVDLDNRSMVGLLPKETFVAPILAMADREDIAVIDSANECFTGEGGDGGGSNSPSREHTWRDLLQA